MIACAYLRKSVAGRLATDDQSIQRGIIEKMAADNNDTIARWYTADWGVSGHRSKLDKRTDYAALIAAVRSGEVRAIYAYMPDRIARSTSSAATLWDACEDDGQPTIYTQGETYRTSNPRDRGRFFDDIEDGAKEWNKIQRRNLDTKSDSRDHILTCQLLGRPHKGKCDDRCRPGEHCERKHDLGAAPPYGSKPGETPVAAIIEAYRTTGSFTRPAKSLTDAGISLAGVRSGRTSPFRRSCVGRSS